MNNITGGGGGTQGPVSIGECSSLRDDPAAVHVETKIEITPPPLIGASVDVDIKSQTQGDALVNDKRGNIQGAGAGL